MLLDELRDGSILRRANNAKRGTVLTRLEVGPQPVRRARAVNLRLACGVLCGVR
jgi:hypothetical protein